MALIIEDGTIVTGADSYTTVAEYIAYWTARGAVPAEITATIEVGLRIGADYIDEEFRSRMTGHQYSKDQPRAYPREGAVYVDGSHAIASNEVPQCVKDAQCEAAKIAMDLTDKLTPATNVGGIKREMVGSLLREYFAPGKNGAKIYPKIERKISPVLWPMGKLIRT